MWKCPYIDSVSVVCLWKGYSWYACQSCFSSMCAGHYLLKKRCDCYCGVQSLDQMLDGASSLLHGCHSPVGGGICSPVVGLQALIVGFDKCVPISACSIPKEVSTEASEVHVVRGNLCIAHAGIHGSSISSPKLCPLLCCVHPIPSARLRTGARAL